MKMTKTKWIIICSAVVLVIASVICVLIIKDSVELDTAVTMLQIRTGNHGDSGKEICRIQIKNVCDKSRPVSYDEAAEALYVSYIALDADAITAIDIANKLIYINKVTGDDYKVIAREVFEANAAVNDIIDNNLDVSQTLDQMISIMDLKIQMESQKNK